MAFLPTDTRIASKADLEGLEVAFAVRMDRFEESLNEVNIRLDRFYITMVTALMGMFATLVAGMLFV